MGIYAEVQEEQWLGEPQQGNFDQGVGVSTQQLQNPNTTVQHTSVSSAHPFMQSPGVWIGIIAVLFLFALIHRKHTDEYKRVRVGFDAWFIVGLMSATFIYAFKVGTAAIPQTPHAIRQFFGSL